MGGGGGGTLRVLGWVNRSISWRHCSTATKGQTTRVARPYPPLLDACSVVPMPSASPASAASQVLLISNFNLTMLASHFINTCCTPQSEPFVDAGLDIQYSKDSRSLDVGLCLCHLNFANLCSQPGLVGFTVHRFTAGNRDYTPEV